VAAIAARHFTSVGIAIALRHSSSVDWDGAVVGFVASLPLKLLNSLGYAAVPESLRPDRFARSAIRQCLAIPSSEWSPELARRVGVLAGRMSRLGFASIVANEVAAAALASSTTAASASPADLGVARVLSLTSIMASVPDDAVEGILRGILSEGDRRLFIECAEGFLSDAAIGKETARLALTKKMLVVRPVSALPSLRLLVSSLKDLGLLQDASIAVISSWSETAFLRHSPYETHSLVTEAVMMLLQEMNKESIKAWNLLGPMLTGIQEHMASSLGRVKKLGMRVAEALSVILDPSKPLKFDQDEPSRLDKEG
jgi:hypothetical protein